MITKYFASTWSWREPIEKVEVERETFKCVWVKRSEYSKEASRSLKESDSGVYFNTWQEAYQWLHDKQQRKVRAAKTRYEGELREMQEIERMEEPDGKAKGKAREAKVRRQSKSN